MDIIFFDELLEIIVIKVQLQPYLVMFRAELVLSHYLVLRGWTGLF